MRRAVVIDDDEPVADLVASILQAHGFDCQVAHSGNTGIRLVLDTLPHLVVCDMRMPGIGGEEVMLSLKAQPATSHIPVVLITGFCEDEYVGMGDAFMTKPFTSDALMATVRELAA